MLWFRGIAYAVVKGSCSIIDKILDFYPVNALHFVSRQVADAWAVSRMSWRNLIRQGIYWLSATDAWCADERYHVTTGYIRNPSLYFFSWWPLKTISEARAFIRHVPRCLAITSQSPKLLWALTWLGKVFRWQPDLFRRWLWKVMLRLRCTFRWVVLLNRRLYQGRAHLSGR